VHTIRTARFVLEPQVAAHAAEMFSVLSDPALYEFEGAPPESEAWLERRFERLELRVSPDGLEGWLNWVIRLPTGALAGYVQATLTRQGIAHIGYELGSKFWRQGIGSAAVSVMMKDVESTHEVAFFCATLKARNHRSLGLLKKLGFLERQDVKCEADEVVMYKPREG
jgi:[ribosomal protein S5]-alanine N-acetyltransferase